jgi:hypothetical protein
VAAVVFAGGVAWYLAGLVGGEAAALTTPKEGGEGHQDDETCPAEKPKCKDCGATLGFCVQPNPGCACDEEEKKCPEEKPKCEATDCGGDNGNVIRLYFEFLTNHLSRQMYTGRSQGL